MEGVEPNENQIGDVARRDSACTDIQSGSTASSCHVEDIRGRKHGRVAEHTLLKKRSELHDVERIEAIVGLRPVRGQRDVNTATTEVRDRCNPGSELEICVRGMSPVR